MSSAKLESPSAERNKEPIWHVLQTKVLSQYTSSSSNSRPLRVLEVAAGSGVHTHYFGLQLAVAKEAAHHRSVFWVPTDPDPASLASQQAYVDQEPALREIVQTPLQLTLYEDGMMESETNAKLDSGSFDLILNINMIHISPWEATVGLMKVAASKLTEGGTLFLYGPFRVNGTCVESNL